MNWKHPFFAAFWIGSAALMIGLPSCKNEPKQPTGATEKSANTREIATAGSLVCGDFETVPLDSGWIYTYYWQGYVRASKVPAPWSITNIAQPPYGAYYITPDDITQLKDLVNSGVIKMDSAHTAWLMLALSPAKTSVQQTLQLYLVCYDAQDSLVFYDIFNAKGLIQMGADTTIANINAATPFVQAYWKQNPTFTWTGPMPASGPLSAFPHGFNFPLCDLIEIAGDAPESNYYIAQFVMEPTKNKPGQYNPDIYIYRDAIAITNIATNTKKQTMNDGGGNTYFDFTYPCPNACPW